MVLMRSLTPVVAMLGWTLAVQPALADCAGVDYAACLSEDETVALVQEVCLFDAPALSGFAAAAVAAGYPQLSNTATSMIMVSGHRDPASRVGVVYSMSKGDVLECTVTTGIPLDAGVDQRLSEAFVAAGYPLTGTGETWNGFTQYVHDGGALGEITVSQPEPSFDTTTDIIVTREAAFE